MSEDDAKAEVIVVPVWFQNFKSKIGSGSSLAPGLRASLVFFLVYLLYGIFHLTVLTDWIGYAVDEGFTAYGAQRIREGQVPYRDFFFLWTPGILGLHAFLQEVGFSAVGERFSSLLAAAGTGALIIRWGYELGLAAWEKLLLAALLLVWGFTLWNIPYSSWLAVFGALSAVRAGQKSKWILAGALFALSFWFKQNVGILSAAGMGAYLALTGAWPVLARMSLSVALGILAPFLLFALAFGGAAFAQAFSQIFLFPLQYPALMSEPLPISDMGAPLAVLGIWMISLYFFRATFRFKALAMAAVIVYAMVGIMREGRGFYGGAFFLLSLVAWASALLAASVESTEKRKAVFFLGLPLLGAFLQVFPRWDLQHFLFVFPISALFLVWSLSCVRKRYYWIPGLWLQMPAIFLLIGGGIYQARVNLLHAYGMHDPVGFISFGDGHNLNQEMAEVRDFLLQEGLEPGGPILVMPNATSFYRFSGFRNPTPHDQFFPGYVAAFGASEKDVLSGYEKAGGRFVVVQQRSKLERFAPVLESQLKVGYEPFRDFKLHFSVWKKKENR